MNKRLSLAAIVIAVALLAACSNEQTYNSLKSYQKNECNKRVDNSDSERCLKETDTSYDEYNKQKSAP